jgi:hypothetical protein
MYLTTDCLVRYIRVVSLSSAPGCEPDIVTQLVERVGDVIGDWLSGAKNSIFGKEIMDSAVSTASKFAAGDIKKRSKVDRKIGQKDNGKATKHFPSKTNEIDIKSGSYEKEALTNGDSRKSKNDQKKRRNYFGSKDRSRGGQNRTSERSEDRATRDDSRHDGAGRKIFVCSGRWITLC